MLMRRAPYLGVKGSVSTSTSVDHPAIDCLVKIERTWNGHVRLDVFEACPLQRTVRSHVERVGLAIELLEFAESENRV